QSVALTLCPAPFDCDISAFRIAGFVETLPKRGNGMRQTVRRLGIEKTDYWHHRLLRTRRERPCRRAAEERDELAAFHSNNSSARMSRANGTSSPKAFAVFKLTSNSTLVGCSTGRSAGLVPFSTRAT